MIQFTVSSDKIRQEIYIPKYYNPEIQAELAVLSNTHDCFSIQDLIKREVISLSTGDEIGKSAYGTGDTPFVRTSDISNWEIKATPKQGISRAIYNQYAEKQDVQVGDILLVKDETYLIGHNCFITAIDKEILYQSHILKIRVRKPEIIAPELLFLALNSPIVQKQLRSIQFTADIIDTIGQRFNEVVLPIPKSEEKRKGLIEKTKKALHIRVLGKAFIKQAPVLIESVLANDEIRVIDDFLALSDDDIASEISSRTVTAEFGEFERFKISSGEIKNLVYLPKYYDPSVEKELEQLRQHCHIMSIAQLRRKKIIEYHTGDEIGKMAYGTGDIPFIRTSDFSNWEIKHDPKQGISSEIYEKYTEREDVQANDIFLIRDGTYLVGHSCIVTVQDEKCLFCGGLYKIRLNQNDLLDTYLLLGLLNSFIVKRQIRTKQFTRDVIDTIGKWIDEVYLPIPKNKETREAISKTIQAVITSRIQARADISGLSNEYCRIQQ